MTDRLAFTGFPGVARATAIPNLYFSTVLPQARSVDELLSFLWLSHFVQAMRGEIRFASADDVWAQEGAQQSFEALGSGRAGVDAGLAANVESGAVLGLRLTSEVGEETLYFVNNPASQRAVGRARAGELRLKPGAVPVPIPVESRPGVFRLYEENIGTITPLIGERLLDAVDRYPAAWIVEAVTTAAELNVRNWRYIERILERWSQEGRDEGTEGDSLEERKRRYLGGDLGHIVKYR